ncbi:hypothetical protein [Streptomyces sp. HUCO-GS316]|uniref:hypothetical protein n=1 Tax=Streptomyces sp. HUCO-GS316 TaxID=2692198 RepID=UPI001926B06A
MLIHPWDAPRDDTERGEAVTHLARPNPCGTPWRPTRTFVLSAVDDYVCVPGPRDTAARQHLLRRRGA